MNFVEMYSMLHGFLNGQNKLTPIKEVAQVLEVPEEVVRDVVSVSPHLVISQGKVAYREEPRIMPRDWSEEVVDKVLKYAPNNRLPLKDLVEALVKIRQMKSITSGYSAVRELRQRGKLVLNQNRLVSVVDNELASHPVHRLNQLMEELNACVSLIVQENEQLKAQLQAVRGRAQKAENKLKQLKETLS